MRKLSATLIMIAILFVGLCIYRGWLTLSRPAADAGSDTININLATDPDKMKQDAELVKEKATVLTGGTNEGARADGQANEIVKPNDL
jgi:hypothetical protein